MCYYAKLGMDSVCNFKMKVVPIAMAGELGRPHYSTDIISPSQALLLHFHQGFSFLLLRLLGMRIE